MRDQDEPIALLLLDYALERLDEPTRADLDERLAQDPALAAKLDRVRAMLEPLDTWAVPPPPTNLVSDILDRVARESYPRLAPAMELPEAERRPGGRGPRIALRDVVALAACIAFFFAVFVPSASRARFMSQRTVCQSNLASMFSGISSYATANAGAMPNVGMRPGVNWLTHSPNRRNLGVLLRFKYVPNAKVFICPSRPDHRPLDETTGCALTTFPQSGQCSYDLQNMAGPTLTLRRAVCLPVVSDANPLFEDGRVNAGVDPMTANSRNHRGRGQNIVSLDGRIRFYVTPNVGDCDDNVWTARNIKIYIGTETQQVATDSFLVP